MKKEARPLTMFEQGKKKPQALSPRFFLLQQSGLLAFSCLGNGTAHFADVFASTGHSTAASGHGKQTSNGTCSKNFPDHDYQPKKLSGRTNLHAELAQTFDGHNHVITRHHCTNTFRSARENEVAGFQFKQTRQIGNGFCHIPDHL
jgi:hypothetical protein